MTGTPQDAYLESQILSTDPLDLVRSLYRGAIDAVRRARAHLAGGRIAERSHEICRALAILGELLAALDHEKGGDLSRRLAALYDYMQFRLSEANFRQKPEPLAEVEGLLGTLLEAWEQIRPASEEPQESVLRTAPKEWESGSSDYSMVPSLTLDAASHYSAQSWSL